jgi:hypothetical protein
MTLRPFVVLATLAIVGAGAPTGSAGQLISPGKLSSAHSALEGIRNCTQCHELRKQGISQALCLSCHEPLARRMEAERGFHAGLADKACGTCHKEHFGQDFALVRLDTLTFDHERAGYTLDGAHTAATCRDCHVPRNVTDPGVRAFKSDHAALDRTFLGLSDRCATCHEVDSPHREQFADRACSDCHETAGWKEPTAFDHQRTDFPLTGEHGGVACVDCHTAETRPGGGVAFVTYVGVAHGRCNDCHEDQHGGAMPGRCDACHTTDGWQSLDRGRMELTFDHRATGFALDGRHATAPCASCHAPGPSGIRAGLHLTFPPGEAGKAFPPPVAEGCLSCHDDGHRGVMPRDCQACHTTAGWRRVERSRVEASFDHASTGFVLEGRHAAAPCSSCHGAAPPSLPDGIHVTFVPGAEGPFPAPQGDLQGCLACHQDRHEGVFTDSPAGAECRACHSASAWAPAQYDAARHNREAGFALEGAHAVVACVDCHKPVDGLPSFGLDDGACASCHESGSPHGVQFQDRSCGACHGVDSFAIAHFDHDTTRFPLDGAHERASCGACHLAETDPSGTARIRYRPLATACRDCHGSPS